MLPWLLFALVSVALLALGYAFATYRATHPVTDEEHREIVATARKQAVKQSRSTRGGQNAEVFAPWIQGFGYEAAETFHLGGTVDLIVFDGLEAGEVRNIVFVEVKTGAAVLNDRQKLVRDAIEGKRVKFETVRVSREGDGSAPTATTVARRKPVEVTEVHPSQSAPSRSTATNSTRRSAESRPSTRCLRVVPPGWCPVRERASGGFRQTDRA